MTGQHHPHSLGRKTRETFKEDWLTYLAVSRSVELTKMEQTLTTLATKTKSKVTPLTTPYNTG